MAAPPAGALQKGVFLLWEWGFCSSVARGQGESCLIAGALWAALCLWEVLCFATEQATFCPGHSHRVPCGRDLGSSVAEQCGASEGGGS